MRAYQPFCMVVIMQNTQEKSTYRRRKYSVNSTKIRKVHANGHKRHTGKEWRL